MTTPGDPSYGAAEQPAGGQPYVEPPIAGMPYNAPQSPPAGMPYDPPQSPPAGMPYPAQQPPAEVPVAGYQYNPQASPQPLYPPAPPYQHMPYQHMPYQYGANPYAVTTTNGLAIASMVLGILWLYWIGSILALVFGYVARDQIKRTGQHGDGMAIAGIVLGWVGIGFLLVGLIFWSSFWF